LRVAARAISLCLALLQTCSFQLLQSLFPGRLAFRPTQEHPPLSSVPRGNSSTHPDTTPPSHSIPIGPASAAPTAGFLQVAVSKARRSSLPAHHSSVEARFRYSTRTSGDCFGLLVQRLLGARRKRGITPPSLCGVYPEVPSEVLRRCLWHRPGADHEP